MTDEYENPYMNAKSLDELKQMEAALYDEVWDKNKVVSSGMEDYYAHQMELFEEAFSTLYPDDYDFHKRNRPK
ncbi:MAG: hypothetical protein ABI947_15795 [Chloroflexota bacterium]